MSDENKKIITRFPPSPTGYLHIGGVRTALFNYLYAKHNGGKFVIRIEDTDKERSKKEYADDILDALQWVGMDWDNDTIPYQSQRTEIYKTYLKKLVDAGLAYISKETPKEAGERDEVIRFKNPGKDISWKDEILGEVSFNTKDLGDFVVAKDLETPLYHLAVVVDDHEMGITHVIRGQEHVSNTPRQILLLEALGFSRPVYGHIPLILAPDKTKLSKRHGAFPATEYRKMGYLPEALINFIAFIGWNPGGEREIYSLKEMIEAFDLSRVQKGGGVFNIEKLDWINREYIKKMSDGDFANKVREFLPDNLKGVDVKKILPAIKDRINKFGDIKDMAEAGELAYYFEAPKYDKALLKDQTYLGDVIEILSKLDENNFTATVVKDALWGFATEKGRGNVLWPMRVALSGREKSPDPFTLGEILGKEETLKRLGAAKDM